MLREIMVDWPILFCTEIGSSTSFTNAIFYDLAVNTEYIWQELIAEVRTLAVFMPTGIRYSISTEVASDISGNSFGWYLSYELRFHHSWGKSCFALGSLYHNYLRPEF
jgi:hypothetical protein